VKNIERRDFAIISAVFSANIGYAYEVSAHWIKDKCDFRLLRKKRWSLGSIMMVEEAVPECPSTRASAVFSACGTGADTWIHRMCIFLTCGVVEIGLSS